MFFFSNVGSPGRFTSVSFINNSVIWFINFSPFGLLFSSWATFYSLWQYFFLLGHVEIIDNFLEYFSKLIKHMSKPVMSWFLLVEHRSYNEIVKLTYINLWPPPPPHPTPPRKSFWSFLPSLFYLQNGNLTSRLKKPIRFVPQVLKQVVNLPC